MSTSMPSHEDPGTSGRARSQPLDEAAFSRLYRDCVGDVHAYAISLLCDRSAAEEVTALAFERLYRSRDRLDAGRGTPRALLFAIARNAALDELRRRRRQPQLTLSEELADLQRSSEDFEQVERRALVREALLSLPLRDREVVLLKFHGQLSNGELAHALGVSVANAGTRLHRALTRLRSQCSQPAPTEVA